MKSTDKSDWKKIREKIRDASRMLDKWEESIKARNGEPFSAFEKIFGKTKQN